MKTIVYHRSIQCPAFDFNKVMDSMIKIFVERHLPITDFTVQHQVCPLTFPSIGFGFILVSIVITYKVAE